MHFLFLMIFLIKLFFFIELITNDTRFVFGLLYVEYKTWYLSILTTMNLKLAVQNFYLFHSAISYRSFTGRKGQKNVDPSCFWDWEGLAGQPTTFR